MLIWWILLGLGFGIKIRLHFLVPFSAFPAILIAGIFVCQSCNGRYWLEDWEFKISFNFSFISLEIFAQTL